LIPVGMLMLPQAGSAIDNRNGLAVDIIAT
jgi:hypothetical protein